METVWKPIGEALVVNQYNLHGSMVRISLKKGWHLSKEQWHFSKSGLVKWVFFKNLRQILFFFLWKWPGG